MQKTIKWGILGCGKIAQKVASDLSLVANAKLVAVGSRDQERASAFGSEYSVDKCYGSYDELASDPEIDVIYIATRHPQHAESTILCLQKGKAVLCEKPLAMNLDQVMEMVQLARSKKLFLMEGLWTRFIPAIQAMLKLINEGEIGDVKMVNADFGFIGDPSKERLFNKEMGGGALLDIGIYPLFISLLTLGIPDKLQASAIFTPAGVDESCSMILSYNKGAMAVLSSTLAANTPTEALIHGSKRSIRVHRPFQYPTKLSLIDKEETVEHIKLPIKGYGYVHEIEHVTDCLQKGLTESDLLPLDFSIELMKLLDGVRKEIGLEY